MSFKQVAERYNCTLSEARQLAMCLALSTRIAPDVTPYHILHDRVVINITTPSTFKKQTAELLKLHGVPRITPELIYKRLKYAKGWRFVMYVEDIYCQITGQWLSVGIQMTHEASDTYLVCSPEIAKEFTDVQF